MILERRGIFCGRDGARELARLLEEELPDAPYEYTNRLIEGRMGSRVEAHDWAARIARSCRCAEEVREIMYDPAS